VTSGRCARRIARPITLSNHTYVEWSARFDCDEPDEDDVITQVRDGVLSSGLKALEQRFGPAMTAMETMPMAAGAE
jgi:hypothetical protein